MVKPTPLQAFNRNANRGPSPSRAHDPAGDTVTGAQALARSLEDLGVLDVFDLPGEAIMPVVDAIEERARLRLVTMCHEQAVGHAAEGYALVSGRVGVCVVSSGSGATNMVTPIADAAMDSVPLLVITGQVPLEAIGTDAFQETDIVGITYPLVKHSFRITDAQDIARVIAEAYVIAGSGRPGPVVVDLPLDIQQTSTRYAWPPRMNLFGYSPVTRAHGGVLNQAAELFARSYRPVLYVGGGAVRANASEQILQLARLTGAPIVTTLPAKGVVPETDPAVLGMLGMQGTIAATGAAQRCDLLVALGARFDDRTTGSLDDFAPAARVIHVDIDPAEIGKNRAADVPIVGDVGRVLTDMIPAITRAYGTLGKPDLSAWWLTINQWRQRFPVRQGPDVPPDQTSTPDTLTAASGSSSQVLDPRWLVRILAEQAGESAIWVTGVGQHQMWASQQLQLQRPHTWISSCGLGSTGYGVPAAIGAFIGAERGAAAPADAAGAGIASVNPKSTETRGAGADRASHATAGPVWLIDGDCGIQALIGELRSALINRTPIKVAVFNNAEYGMLRQWRAFMRGSGSAGHMDHEDRTDRIDGDAHTPDFVMLAQAYGCVGMRASTMDEARDAIAKANAIDALPVVIEFNVDRNAMVWPMVPPGKSNDAVMYAPDVYPLRAGTNGERKSPVGRAI